MPVLDNPAFRADYEKLRDVKLNPARHVADTAHEHCEMVAARVAHLAALNGCTSQEVQVLRDLAYVHDIGKIAGTANPEKSVELLPRYGIEDERLTELVKSHDTNLPWYLSFERGQAPSDKAWRKLASKADLRLLCLFMVADRVDCPGGWRTNRPLVWFLEEVRKRNLLPGELKLDDGPPVAGPSGKATEVCAGAALVRSSASSLELLVIRTKGTYYELPTGHLEWDETPEQAAVRELREETSLLSVPKVVEALGTLEYSFESAGSTIQKRVDYYVCLAPASEPMNFGGTPSRTKEVRWIKEAEVDELPLVNEELRSILRKAFRVNPDRPNGRPGANET